jgi:hypothetical protein
MLSTRYFAEQPATEIANSKIQINFCRYAGRSIPASRTAPIAFIFRIL